MLKEDAAKSTVKKLTKSDKPNSSSIELCFATLCVVTYIEHKFQSKGAQWQLVVLKARKLVTSLCNKLNLNAEDIKTASADFVKANLKSA
jgi:hypothetical protein